MEPKIGLSIYLLRQGAMQAVRQELLAGSIPLANGFDGEFKPVFSSADAPKWFLSLRQYLAPGQQIDLKVQTPAGIVLINRGGNSYVVTFGHAWQKLRDEWLVPDFGRKVALNAIPQEQLLAVNSEQVFSRWHVASERAPKATSANAFGIEHDRDLVYAIEGVPSEPIFGGVVRGSTSLRLSIQLSALIDALDRAEVLYGSDDYKSHWPEIDNLTPVQNDLLIAKLHQMLDRDLTAGLGPKKIVLSAPSVRRGEALIPESYVFGRHTKSAPVAPYLMFGSWQTYLAKIGEKPSLELARKTPVHLIDSVGEQMETRNIYECMGYEGALDGCQYILSSGIWYEAVDKFVASINATIKKLQKPAISLPNWNATDSEGAYNAKCGARNGFLHFDAKNIQFGGGKSRFEFCDFMHPTKKILFFAKIPTNSAHCSHLVEQVRRTVELTFAPDSSFRVELKKVMKKHHPKANRDWLDERPRPGDWNLCLVSLGKEAMHLPFFARCGLARLVRSMHDRSHEVSFLAV